MIFKSMITIRNCHSFLSRYFIPVIFHNFIDSSTDKHTHAPAHALTHKHAWNKPLRMVRRKCFVLRNSFQTPFFHPFSMRSSQQQRRNSDLISALIENVNFLLLVGVISTNWYRFQIVVEVFDYAILLNVTLS